MAEPILTATRLAGSPDRRSLRDVGPSLGTSAEDLWRAVAERLADRFEVVGWDLPGHGRSRTAAEPFTVADLAIAVRLSAARVPALVGPGELDVVFPPDAITATTDGVPHSTRHDFKRLRPPAAGRGPGCGRRGCAATFTPGGDR